MTLRPGYSLGHSQYNDFLFASVGLDTGGVETHGDELTVLSALSRLDVDPWREAARLSDLSHAEAAAALAATLARLPDANWKAADAVANAARLAALLPDRSEAAVPPVQGNGTSPTARARIRLQEILGTGTGNPSWAPAADGGTPAQKPALNSWLVWLVLAAAGFAIFTHLQGGNSLEIDHPRTGTTQQL